MIGRILDHYEIQELIGIGGAAEVYRAVDLATSQEVALKVLNERADPPMILRFTREAKILARLNHPNIVSVHEAGFAEGLRYLAMDLVRGGSLKDCLQEGPLPWPEAVRVAASVARALEHAHTNDIIHRDIKPGNIMLTQGDISGGMAQPDVRLMDFGLAHLSDASTMTRTGTVMGTVYYLSPEQALGKHVDLRSDLYALGAVLYEMLIGEPPFTGPSAVSIIYKHLNEPPPRVRQTDPTVPALLEAIIERLLQKDADRRFASASDLIQALDAVTLHDSTDEAEETLLAEVAPEQPLDEHRVSRLVGRDAELDQLVQALDRAASGMGATVLISGEAGTGKTRLSVELCRVSAERDAFALRGECLYGDAPNPYAVYGEVVSSLRNQWAALPECVSQDERAAEVEAVLVDAARLLRIDGSLSSVEGTGWIKQLSPMDGQAHAFEVITQLFVQAARVRPLVLVLDDLQWGSSTTLQLFHYLARATRGTRVLLVGVYRPEELLSGTADERHPLRETIQRMSRERLYEEIALGSMDLPAVGQLAADALGVTSLDPDLVAVLHRESEGNPFYVLEMIALLQEQGALERVEDRWEFAADLNAIQVPDSVYGVVVRRIERGAMEDRDLLDWAAVLGHRLDVEVLAELVGGTRLAVLKRLHALAQRSGLISADEAGFHFAHAKVREILYQELPPALRRECHLMAGEQLEARARGRLATHVYELAHHFVRAEDPVRAFRYSVMAGDKAERASALHEAADHLQDALRFLPQATEVTEPDDELRLQHRYGRLLSTVGRMDQARAAFERGLALSETLGDRRMQSTILLALGSLHGRSGEWAQAIALGEQSLALASDDMFAEGQADALLSTGFFAFERGDWDFAIAQLKRALAIASREANEVQKARILGNMAIMYNARGRSPKAIELFRESIATFDRLNLPLDVVRGLNNLGFCHHSLGEYDEARACYHQALERLGKVGDLRERGLLYLHIAETALAQQDLNVARENCVLAARRFGRLGFDLGLADVNRVYAGIARRERRLRVAERYLRAALAVYEEHGDRLNIAETHEELSRLLDERGQQDEAEEELSRSRLIFERLAEQPSEIF